MGCQFRLQVGKGCDNIMREVQCETQAIGRNDHFTGIVHGVSLDALQHSQQLKQVFAAQLQASHLFTTHYAICQQDSTFTCDVFIP